MKKGRRILLTVLLLAGVFIGGYELGVNKEMAAGDGGYTEDGKIFSREDGDRIMRNIETMNQMIDKDFIFPYEAKDLEVGIYKGLFAGLHDPYSTFYSQEEFDQLMEETSGHFAGVGLEITAGEDGLITVVTPIKGTPAAEAGIKSGDKIIAIDGETYLGEDLQEATQVMRGEKGTEVVLTIRRGEKNRDVTLVRSDINMETVQTQMLESGVGYLTVSAFDENTAEDFKAGIDQLRNQGMTRLVLDLRNNPGGLLESVVQVSDYLLPKGKIVSIKDKAGEEESYNSDADYYDMPMVVLINEGSASASEILTAALRDYNRALVVGKTSFGKGIVQKLYPLTAQGVEGGIKLTMAEYLTPSGDHIHGKGVKPDIEVDLPEEVDVIGPLNFQEDLQLQESIKAVLSLNGSEVTDKDRAQEAARVNQAGAVNRVA